MKIGLTDLVFPTSDASRNDGLSKRELFAAMAMQGLCANSKTPMDEIASESVKQADSLIEALNKEAK